MILRNFATELRGSKIWVNGNLHQERRNACQPSFRIEHSNEPRWRAKADVGKRQKLI